MPKSTKIKKKHWQHIFSGVIDSIPNILVWVKDLEGHFIMVNDNLIKMNGFESKADMLGKTDFDISPRYLAEGYVNDDHKVINSGQPLKEKIELIQNIDGITDWYKTIKLPVFDDQDDLICVGGFSLYFKKSDQSINPIMKMASVIDFIMENYSRTIEVKELADIMCVSISSFERQFKKQFNQTPLKYLNQIRIEAVSRLLINTDLTISEISMRTGFYDQSHLSRNFIKIEGVHPTQYRKNFASGKSQGTPKKA